MNVRPPFGCRCAVVAAFAVLVSFLQAVQAQFAYTRLRDCNFTTGGGPSGLVRASDGFLYGTMAFGGESPGFAAGVVYRTNSDGSGYQVLHVFDDDAEGASPSGSLAEGNDGRLYGVCLDGGLVAPGLGGQGSGTVFRIDKDGSDFEVVKQFDATNGAGTTGRRPVDGLRKAGDGRIFGATRAGGTSGAGTLFSITIAESGVATVAPVFNFASQGLGEPLGVPIEGPDGKLYGITTSGGVGFGVLYRIGKDGSGYETLHAFSAAELSPQGLVKASDSQLVGTTFSKTFTAKTNILFGFDFTEGYAQIGDLTSKTATASFFDVLTVASDGRIYGAQADIAGGFSIENGRISRVDLDGTGLQAVLPMTGDRGTFAVALVESSPLAFVGITSTGGTADGGTIFRMQQGTTPGQGTLPSAVKQSGAKKIRTTKGKVKLAGSCAGGSDFKIEFRVGRKGAFKPAKGTSKWTLTVKVKPGKNFVFVRAKLADGSTSKELKLTIIRE